MEWDITDYWSNLWEQIRSAWARFTAIRLLVQNAAAYRERDEHAGRIESEVPPAF